MPRRLTRSILPILATALAVSGCGGGGGTSPAAYHTKVNAAIAPWEFAVGTLRRGITPTRLRAVANTARRGATAVSGLKAPSEVASLQPQLVAVLDQNAHHADQWAQALDRRDTGAVKRFAADFHQDGDRILRIDAAYRAKGVTL